VFENSQRKARRRARLERAERRRPARIAAGLFRRS
jgi:hypothetical protein